MNTIKKIWEKPEIITIKEKELKKYIQAAAYSGTCGGGVGR